MNEPVDIEVVRAEALRKVGRNVVNFSKIEAGFKQLLLVSRLEGTEKTISEQSLRNQTRLCKQTLGKLVQEYTKNILGDDSQSEPATDSSEPGISFSFKIICNNSDVLRERKRTLSKIVEERNKLIHQDLARLDTSSVEDYRKLISLLDEQNPRLLAHLDYLRSMMESLENSWKILKDLSKSPGFLQCLQFDQIDQTDT